MSTKGIVILILVIVVGGAFIGIFAWMRANREYNYGYIVIKKDKDFVKRYNFPGTGTADNPYRIENLTINVQSIYGILITGTTSHFVIRNCTISGNAGIYLQKVKTGTAEIINNTITVLPESYGIGLESAPGTEIKQNKIQGETDKQMLGINIFSSPDCLIAENTLQNLFHGIEIWGISDNAVIRDNYCENCDIGIFLDARNWYSYPEGFHEGSLENMLVEANECFKNKFGIYLLGEVSQTTLTQNNCSFNTLVAIELHSCSEITLMENVFHNNTMGLTLIYATSVTVKENLFRNSLDYAINATYSTGSNFYWNNFYNNNINGQALNHTQAFDNNSETNPAEQNNWYNVQQSEGNYWDDWSGVGSYLIEGGENKDLYPLAAPY